MGDQEEDKSEKVSREQWLKHARELTATSDTSFPKVEFVFTSGEPSRAAPAVQIRGRLLRVDQEGETITFLLYPPPNAAEIKVPSVNLWLREPEWRRREDMTGGALLELKFTIENCTHRVLVSTSEELLEEQVRAAWSRSPSILLGLMRMGTIEV